MQVQQPTPFVPTPAPNAASPGPATSTPAPTVATTSPSEPAGQRRRRRTQAEMAAAAPQGPNGSAAPVQAPFPHPASPAATPGTAPIQTDTGFGMAAGTPAAADPGMTQMLDNFFKQG